MTLRQHLKVWRELVAATLEATGLTEIWGRLSRKIEDWIWPE